MSIFGMNDNILAGHVKTPEEIEKMRVAGRLTARVLEAVTEIIKPGITTMEINDFCERYIVETLHAIPGSKGQYGFPYAVNTSVNSEICHGMPSVSKVLKKGDIVNVDVTVIKDGYFGDSSKTFCVGPVKPSDQLLVDVTQQCLYKGIKVVKPGATVGDIGHAIQEHAKKHYYSVVREFCGHGIGKNMHEEPNIPHLGEAGTGAKLLAGVTFTIEPMINQGKPGIKIVKKLRWPNDKKGWEVASTIDHRPSAQWEHTILVTESGFEILTLRDEEKDLLPTLLA